MKKTLKILICFFAALLCAELCFLGYLHFKPDPEGPSIQADPITLPTQTSAPSTEDNQQPESQPTDSSEIPTETAAPTETVPPTTEAGPERFLLTFAGDCTLGSSPGDFASPHSFIGTVGTDYGYPFRNVAEYFDNDDFTMINLESVIADSGYAAAKLFCFRGPTEYTQILTGSSVEAVTLANNHTGDFGKDGYDSTIRALTDAGVSFVEENKTKIVTTASGLTIGLYADAFTFKEEDIKKNVQSLRSQGAEIIICAYHWGTEGSYRATATQEKFAHASIDAGADIVYGHHPHVLQRIENYGKGVIMYSLGNFSFGGNNFPRDLDSALIQLEVIREKDGTVRLGEMNRIPVSISSMAVQNNFQPTPYAVDSAEYLRTLSKLDGTFTGPDLNVDYSHLKPTEPPVTEPPATEPPAGDNPPTQPGQSGGENPAPEGGDTPPAEGGDTPPADSGNTGSTPETPPPAPEGGDSSAAEG